MYQVEIYIQNQGKVKFKQPMHETGIFRLKRKLQKKYTKLGEHLVPKWVISDTRILPSFTSITYIDSDGDGVILHITPITK